MFVPVKVLCFKATNLRAWVFLLFSLYFSKFLLRQIGTLFLDFSFSHSTHFLVLLSLSAICPRLQGFPVKYLFVFNQNVLQGIIFASQSSKIAVKTIMDAIKIAKAINIAASLTASPCFRNSKYTRSRLLSHHI